MGTEISLTLGRFQIDYGKNFDFQNHCALFQKSDLGIVPDYGYDKPLMMEGYSRSLRKIIGRLELLGYTLETVKKEYISAQDEWGDAYRRPLSYKKLYDFIKTVNVGAITGKWSNSKKNKFVPKKIMDNFSPHKYSADGHRPDFWDLEILLEGFSTYAKLRLLAENPKNLNLPVIWPFGELAKNWVGRENFLVELEQQKKFLIITEGSTDTKIIQKVLCSHREEYADFFQFIDVEKGQHFDGTESLYKFCKRLVSIGVLNRVIFLYDNDSAGISRYNDTKKLSLPKNIVTSKLPDIRSFKKFDTIGPKGEKKEDINGKAASIECYLDLSHGNKNNKPRIRWSSYIESIGQYQGALEDKSLYTKHFLSLKHRDATYDYSKLEILLDHLYDVCVKMAST